jgi:hypothetical protein
VHQVEPGPTSGQLTVAAVDAAPRLEHVDDTSPLRLQQPLHGPAAARQVIQPPGGGTVPPPGNPVRVHCQQPAGAAG